ncbi:MAG: hypothetical protein JXA73_12000, partial [Acidobacteria bacterium]|nr:hypothetical protein [Acidobacteriota bacterium]
KPALSKYPRRKSEKISEKLGYTPLPKGHECPRWRHRKCRCQRCARRRRILIKHDILQPLLQDDGVAGFQAMLAEKLL